MEIMDWIQNWYDDNCDNDWEHMFGIKIYTVDNPGWAVEIDLKNTKIENKLFNKIQYDHGDSDWLLCYVKDSVFQGNGDSHKLSMILDIFKTWASE